MSIADGVLSGDERGLLNQFASLKKFDAEKVKDLVAKAKSLT